MPNITYLDYNATCPVRPEVMARVTALIAEPHNASSVHFYGREAKKHLENAREIIAMAVNAWKNEIIFTAGGTESNNAALHHARMQGRKILVSDVEHSSILKTVPEADIIAVDENGIVRLDALEKMLHATADELFVAVMHANNETGVIQPIAEIAKLCKAHGKALLHVDAAQSLGKISVDFSMMGADMMTLSAHKMGGVQGAAALVLRNDLPILPLLKGGGQEMGRRAGTENIAAISGFALAVELAQKDTAHLQQLRIWLDAMETEIAEFAPEAIILGRDVARLPNTSCIAMPHVGSETQLMTLDLSGIAVSAGSACSSGRIEPSHVIQAMGHSREVAGTALRISGGWNTKEEDILKMTREWKKLYERVGRKKAS